MLDIPAREMTTVKRKASDLHVKWWDGIVVVAFKPGHENTLTEADDAVSLVIGASEDFSSHRQCSHRLG